MANSSKIRKILRLLYKWSSQFFSDYRILVQIFSCMLVIDARFALAEDAKCPIKTKIITNTTAVSDSAIRAYVADMITRQFAALNACKNLAPRGTLFIKLNESEFAGEDGHPIVLLTIAPQESFYQNVTVGLPLTDPRPDGFSESKINNGIVRDSEILREKAFSWLFTPQQRELFLLDFQDEKIMQNTNALKSWLKTLEDQQKYRFFLRNWQHYFGYLSDVKFDGVSLRRTLENNNISQFEYLFASVYKEELIASVLYGLKTIPENFHSFLRKHPSSFLNLSTAPIDCGEVSNGAKGLRAGTYQPDTKRVALCLEDFHKTRSDTVNDWIIDMHRSTTIVHELGHHIDFQLPEGVSSRFANFSWKRWFSWQKRRALELSRDDSEFVSDYAKTNTMEDFAESFEEYIFNNRTMKIKAPRKFMFFSALETCIVDADIEACMDRALHAR